MKDEILAAAKTRAGMGCTRADKICDLLTCSQSTTNITSLTQIFTFHRKGSIITLSSLSLSSISVFLLFVRPLRSGWIIIILLAWQNYLSVSPLKPNFFLFFFVSWTIIKLESTPLPSVSQFPFCTVYSLLLLLLLLSSSSPSTTAACTFAS